MATHLSELLGIAAALLVGSSICYGLLLLVLSRHRSPSATYTSRDPGSEPLVVFMLPCLNEGRVIGASLERLLTIDYPRARILVIDDGSKDDTAEVAKQYADRGVLVLQRKLPDACRGKGAALNAGIRWLLDGDFLRGWSHHNVIVVVVDADGRLEQQAVRKVVDVMADPGIGAVQIGVRINNRHVNLLARMQDIEFVVYTEVFQRGRNHLGSVGMGGNGQFMRLSALLDLGRDAWSPSLTEDLDLGVRLLAAGWRTEFCADAAVHQQGLVELPRLLRQRTRWFQGHLQAWRLVPLVVRTMKPRARADLLYHLTSPFLLLTASLLSAAFLVGILATSIRFSRGFVGFEGWMVTAYVLSFGPSLIYHAVYVRKEKSDGYSVISAVLNAHLYVVYGLMWYLCGWSAVWRTLRGRTSWVKTARSMETSDTTTEPDDVPVTTTITTALGGPAIEGLEGGLKNGFLAPPPDQRQSGALADLGSATIGDSA